MNPITVALVMVQVTMAYGARVYVNPAFVSRIYPTKEAAGGVNQLVVKGAKCVITMNDGKFMSVLEDCDFLRRKLEGRIR